MVHLDAAGTWREGGDALDNLKGWGALVADALRRDLPTPPPNRTRWAHVDTSRLTRDLTRRG